MEKVNWSKGVKTLATSEERGDSKAKAKNDRYQYFLHVIGNKQKRKGDLYSVIKEVV